MWCAHIEGTSILTETGMRKAGVHERKAVRRRTTTYTRYIEEKDCVDRHNPGPLCGGGQPIVCPPGEEIADVYRHTFERATGRRVSIALVRTTCLGSPDSYPRRIPWEVIHRAMDSVTPDPWAIGLNPHLRGITQLETFLWAEGSPAYTARSAIEGYEVAATARATAFTFETGDGHWYTSEAPGSP